MPHGTSYEIWSCREIFNILRQTETGTSSLDFPKDRLYAKLSNGRTSNSMRIETACHSV